MYFVETKSTFRKTALRLYAPSKIVKLFHSNLVPACDIQQAAIADKNISCVFLLRVSCFLYRSCSYFVNVSRVLRASWTRSLAMKCRLSLWNSCRSSGIDTLIRGTPLTKETVQKRKYLTKHKSLEKWNWSYVS